jgi:diacylglycerol kinase (ATP)
MNKPKTPKATGFLRLFKAAQYSLAGFRAAWKFETAFWQECMLAFVLMPIALLLKITPAEKVLLIMSVVIVIIVELLNSAIEAVVDRLGQEFHELSGRAKDMGSAAVMLALMLMVFVWLFILIL